MKKSKKFAIIALVMGLISLTIELIIFFASGDSISGEKFIYPQIILLIVAIAFNFNGIILDQNKLIFYSSIAYLLSVMALISWGFIVIPSTIITFKSVKEFEEEEEREKEELKKKEKYNK